MKIANLQMLLLDTVYEEQSQRDLTVRRMECSCSYFTFWKVGSIPYHLNPNF